MFWSYPPPLLPNSSQIYPLPPSLRNCMSTIPAITHWVQLVCLCLQRCGISHWSIVNSPRAMPLEETDAPSPRSHQLSTDPQLEVRAHEPLPNFMPEDNFFLVIKCVYNFPSEYCLSWISWVLIQVFPSKCCLNPWSFYLSDELSMIVVQLLNVQGFSAYSSIIDYSLNSVWLVNIFYVISVVLYVASLLCHRT